MKFIETFLKGAFIIDMEPIEDERGFFARTWCAEECQQHGLATTFVQCNVSFNKYRGTLRGLHYQTAPHEEAKWIRCTRGAVYDVIVDIRPHSDTYLHWFGIELTESNQKMLYVPVGMAHGFQTLQDNSEMFYQMSHMYVAGFAKGIRWDDPSINIKWPVKEKIISDRDRTFPLIYR